MIELKKIYFYSSSSDTYQLYQHYYLMGFTELGLAVEYVGQKENRFLKQIKRRLLTNHPERFRGETEHVGQYIFEFSNGITKKVAIDAHDHHYLWAPDICAWSDIYFKCNFRNGFSYPQKVFPFMNGNGFLSGEDISYLKDLRQKEKTFDLCFISRLWGGIEHNIRLFESLAQVDCSKKLLAVFPSDWAMKDKKELVKRLEKVGVSWTDELIPNHELWEYCSSSRHNLLRAGKYLCTPWRLVDLLAMGSSIILDDAPTTRWHQPLEKNKHYSSLEIIRNDTAAGEDKRYDGIAKSVELFLLGDEHSTMSQEAAGFFDQYIQPRKCAEYLLETVASNLDKQWGSI